MRPTSSSRASRRLGRRSARRAVSTSFARSHGSRARTRARISLARSPISRSRSTTTTSPRASRFRCARPSARRTAALRSVSGTSAAGRVSPEPELTREPTEVVIADTIRTQVDSLWRKRPHLGGAIGAAAAPATKAVGKTVAVGFELMPRRAAPLPRHADTARDRSKRQRRAASFLAVALLLVGGIIGAVAYRDYQANRVNGDYQLAILSIENDLSAAQRAADRKPPDNATARERLDRAVVSLNEAARSPAASATRVAALPEQTAALDDRISGVIVDLGRRA